jgi:NAD+ synthase
MEQEDEMPQDRLRLAMIQENPTVGDLDGNATLAITHITENRHVDLIIFNECFVTGYPLGDLVLRHGFLRDTDRAISRIRDHVIATGGPAVLIGAPIAGTGLPFNGALLIEPSGSTRVVRKTELPNSDVFDERRTFAMAEPDSQGPLPFRGFRLGVMICEDMWHGRVARHLSDELAEVLIALNGSPYQGGKHQVRLANAQARVRATGLPLIYLNQVGGQDELVFDGGSFTLNTDGAVMCARAFSPDVMQLLLRRDDQGLTHVEAFEDAVPGIYPTDRTLTDYQACVLGLRDYVAKTEAPCVFVGVSGGLDSALVLTMAVDALGPDRVVGVMMPSPHTGPESLALADELMRRLGTRRRVLPITDPYEAVDAALSPLIADLGADLGLDRASEDLARENYQARLRGLLLMGLTNALGGIVLSTGNKSEMAVGYATLYGDMAGGFNPLKSVYKSDAFQMARWRNGWDGGEMSPFAPLDPIPDGILTRPPTAELAEGQTDAKSLGDYAALDLVLRALIEEGEDARSAARRLEIAFGDELPALINGAQAVSYAERVSRMVRNAQYKRVQAPPGVKLNPTDFGLGWRYPLAGNYTL